MKWTFVKGGGGGEVVTAAIPAAPPFQPSIGQSQSIPSDFAPPTEVFLTTSSPTAAPIVAITTRMPSDSLGALLTTATGASSLPSARGCSLAQGERGQGGGGKGVCVGGEGVAGHPPPISTFSELSLSLPGTGDTSRMTPTQ